MFTFSPRPCTPGRNPRCVVFAWIGQSFQSCDSCGRPRTEHLFDPPYGGQRPILHVKQLDRPWDPELSGWHWEPVGSLVMRKEAA